MTHFVDSTDIRSYSFVVYLILGIAEFILYCYQEIVTPIICCL